MKLDWPWTATVIALAIIATAGAFASPAVADMLRADHRIFDGGAWWSAFSGPFVHATWGHLVRDVALIAIAGIAYEAPLARTKRLLFLAGLGVPTFAVLVTHQASWYCGLSGLSHAMLAAVLAFEACRRRGAARAITLAVCAIAALKPLYELSRGQPAFAMSLGADVKQVPLAHAVGVVIGIACGVTSAVMEHLHRCRAATETATASIGESLRRAGT